MQASDIPLRIQVPFAQSAGGSFVGVIPVPSQIGVVDGRASFTTGFVPDNFTPPSAGGVPPFGQDVNGILLIITEWVRWYCAGAPVAFNLDFANAVAGYPAGAVVASPTIPGAFWLNTLDNNTNDPEGATTPSGWVDLASNNPRVRKVTASTTLDLDCGTDYAIALMRSAALAAMTINLAATGTLLTGKTFRISDIRANLNAYPATIVPPAGHIIAGSPNFTMSEDKQSASFVFYGAGEWDVST